MHERNETYERIYNAPHYCEVRCSIDGVEYDWDRIVSLSTSHRLFDSTPQIGKAICGEIDLVVIPRAEEIPSMAEIRVSVRLVASSGEETTDWIPKGVFFIDTREATETDGIPTLTLHGYDAMLTLTRDLKLNNDTWSKNDAQTVAEICRITGLELDPRTKLGKGYRIPDPGRGSSAYSCREVLAMIGAMYGGSWIINDAGQLRLIQIAQIPADPGLLTTETGEPIEIGGVLIRA